MSKTIKLRLIYHDLQIYLLNQQNKIIDDDSPLPFSPHTPFPFSCSGLISFPKARQRKLYL